jgi:ferredoxin
LKLLGNKLAWLRRKRYEAWIRQSIAGIARRHGTDFRITKLWLDESENECDMCGACEFVAPQVFQVPEKLIINQNADFDAERDKVIEGVMICPTGVIAAVINGKEKINSLL